MIQIIIHRHKNTNRIFKYVTAGQADDLICNTVSVLTQTPIMGIDWLGYKPYRLRIRQNGYLEVIIGNGEIDERVQALLETMVLGLQSVERQYPDEVKITSESSIALW